MYNEKYCHAIDTYIKHDVLITFMKHEEKEEKKIEKLHIKIKKEEKRNLSEMLLDVSFCLFFCFFFTLLSILLVTSLRYIKTICKYDTFAVIYYYITIYILTNSF